MGELALAFVCGSLVTGWLAWLWLCELRRIIRAFIAQETDYMRRNGLGDPERQRLVIWARKALGDTPND